MLTASHQSPPTMPTIDVSPSIPPTTWNKIAERWKKKIQQRQAKKYIIDQDDDELRQGILSGTIASTIVGSGTTSGIGTTTDPSRRPGRQSTKQFILPSGAIVPATEIAEYPFAIRAPANELHITPGVMPMLITSLSSTRTLSTSTTPMTRRSPSPKAPYCAGGAILTSSYGESRSLTWCGTTSPTRSSSTDHRPSSYKHAHHQATPSTTSMS